MMLFLEPWCQIVQGQFKGFVLGSSEYKGGNWVTCLMIVSKWNFFCLLPPYRHHWHKTKTNVSTSLGACKLSAFCVAKDWLTIARWTLCPAMQRVLVLVKLCKCILHMSIFQCWLWADFTRWGRVFCWRREHFAPQTAEEAACGCDTIVLSKLLFCKMPVLTNLCVSAKRSTQNFVW